MKLPPVEPERWTCLICRKPCLETEYHWTVGQGLYYPGMSEEDRKALSQHRIKIPGHEECFKRLSEED